MDLAAQRKNEMNESQNILQCVKAKRQRDESEAQAFEEISTPWHSIFIRRWRSIPSFVVAIFLFTRHPFSSDWLNIPAGVSILAGIGWDVVDAVRYRDLMWHRLVRLSNPEVTEDLEFKNRLTRR